MKNKKETTYSKHQKLNVIERNSLSQTFIKWITLEKFTFINLDFDSYEMISIDEDFDTNKLAVHGKFTKRKRNFLVDLIVFENGKAILIDFFGNDSTLTNSTTRSTPQFNKLSAMRTLRLDTNYFQIHSNQFQNILSEFNKEKGFLDTPLMTALNRALPRK